MIEGFDVREREGLRGGKGRKGGGKTVVEKRGGKVVGWDTRGVLGGW